LGLRDKLVKIGLPVFDPEKPSKPETPIENPVEPQPTKPIDEDALVERVSDEDYARMKKLLYESGVLGKK